MMDDQVFEMLRDRLQAIDDHLIQIESAFKEHVTKDETYWQRVDIQQGQLSTLKLVLGSSAFAGFLAGAWAWLTSKIGG